MNQAPAKDPQIVTSSKRRVDEDRALLDFEFKMGTLTVAVTAQIPEPGKRSAPVGASVQIGRQHPCLLNVSNSTLRVTREAEYLVIPLDFGMLQLRILAKVTDEGEPDGVVYVNFKLPPLGTSLVQTVDGRYPEAAHG